MSEAKEPWACCSSVGDVCYILGPRSKLYELEEWNDLGFVSPELFDAGYEKLSLTAPIQADTAIDTACISEGQLLITREKDRSAAESLRLALQQLTGSTWTVVDDVKNLRVDVLYLDLSNGSPWQFAPSWSIPHYETSEGLCLGPFPREGIAVPLLVDWRDRQLMSMQFVSRPSTLAYWSEKCPAELANCLVLLANSAIGTCVLPELGRMVTLRSTLTTNPIDGTRLDQLVWQYGAANSLNIKKILNANAYVGTAECDVTGIPDLAGCFGKGWSPSVARITTIGECLERIAAAEAAPASDRSAPSFPLSCFHPFGSEWEDYGQFFESRLESPALDLTSGEEVRVPFDAVVFPLLEGQGWQRSTKSDSCGLAIYPTYEGAVLRATLEVLERDNFYPSFIHLREGVRLINQPKLSDLRSKGFKVAAIRYQPDGALPFLIHAFVEHQDYPLLARGSGSGFCCTDAVEKALAEAIQIHHLGLNMADLNDASSIYNEWCSAELRCRVWNYLSSFAEVDPQDSRIGRGTSEREQLDFLLVEFRKSNRKLLVCTLPSPINGWTAVRVLVPGATCHQYASSSLGGEILKRPAFPNRIIY